LSALGATIDLTGASGTLLNFAFSVPRDGVITSIAAYFSTTLGITLLATTVTIEAQLYSSATPDNTFSPIGPLIALAPSLTGTVGIGQISNAIATGLTIPVTAETRILMVFSISVVGVNLVTAVEGYASAGITII
jgi:BclB C-terminal domain-containing protein